MHTAARLVLEMCIDAWHTLPSHVSNDSRTLFNGWELTFKHMSEQAQAAQPCTYVSHIRIGLENSTDTHHEYRRWKWLFLEAKAERHTVRQHVEPENSKEEFSEGVKHLGKEVPPYSWIRREVW